MFKSKKLFKSKKMLTLISVLALSTFVIAGCGSDNPDTGNNDGGTGDGKDTLKVAMVTDTGGVSDQSFNQSAWEGLQNAEKDLGVSASYKESNQDADYVPNLETVLDDGNGLIWGIGFKLEAAIRDAAEMHTDQKYGIIDYSYEDDGVETPENVMCVMFNDEHSSFLVGYIAAQMSETGKVGFVGGIEGPVIDRFDYGYRAGVDYSNEQTGKNVEVLVQYAESFGDSAKGKAIALQMYQQGADIVFHAAGNVGTGVIEAAKEQEKYAIGVDRDQNELAPDNVITSAIKRVDLGTYNGTKDVLEDNFKGGQTVRYGLEDGAVDIAPTSDKHVPKEILDKVEELKKEIIDGKIDVAYNKETFNK